MVNLAGVLSYRETHVLTTSTVVDMADSSDQSMDIVDPLARLVAIAAVRARRHSKALYNEHFVTWLHENPLR